MICLLRFGCMDGMELGRTVHETDIVYTLGGLMYCLEFHMILSNISSTAIYEEDTQ